MKRSEIKIGTVCLYDDRKVEILTTVQKDGTVGIGWLPLHDKEVALTVDYEELRSLSDKPTWLTKAIDASEDFKYGIKSELEAVWESDLTIAEKRAKVERMMITARRASEETTSSRTSSAGRRYK